MQLIVITCAGNVQNEAAIINELFAAGLICLHLRKLDSSVADVGHLLDNIDSAFYARIALHQHHKLAPAYGITRLHYTERARSRTHPEVLRSLKCDGFTLSTSVHDVQLVPSLSVFDYAFLGPVFNSLSKPGYQGSLSPSFRLDRNVSKPQLIAIGGIEASRLPALKAMGFNGAAVLGTIWNAPENALTTFKELQASCLN